METLEMAYAHSAMQLSYAAQAPRRFGQRSSRGRQAQQHRLSARALQRARSTSSLVIPPFSPIDEKNCLLGKGISASGIERLASERRSLSRLDVELVLRGMVRAEEETSEEDVGGGPDKTNESGHQLWIDRARNMQTTVQIFSSMMFWIMLFFITSMWDNENPVRYRRRDRGRRK